MKKGFLFLVLFTALNGLAQSQYFWNQQVQKTYEAVGALRIPEVRKTIERELNNHTNNLLISSIRKNGTANNLLK